MELIFITGKTPLLSRAELKSVLPPNSITHWNEYAVFAHADSEIEDARRLQDRLGGTLKICEVIETISVTDSYKVLEHLLEPALTRELSHQEGKRRFGISIYPLSHSNKKILKQLLIFLKKKLKSLGNIRFVNKNFTNVASIQIAREKLIDEKKGVEFIIVTDNDRIAVGKTITCQNIIAYAKRDYEKPARDPYLGMIPPKLAQIMINLAYPLMNKKDPTIYDPFCGTGTILGEALLMNYNVIGSDNSNRALEETGKNLAWIQNIFPETHDKKIALFQHDVEKTFPLQLKEKTISAIVTESYLGPPMNTLPAREKLSQIQQYLLKLDFTFFENLQPLLNQNTPIVIALPLFGEMRYTQTSTIEEKVKTLGFKKYEPLAKTPLLYQRKNQVVGREIQIWIR